MINRKVITKEQALNAIATGEFGDEVRASKAKVVVIMTQDWCPQWRSLSSWVYGIDTREDVDVYELVYNKVDYSREFMGFKESVWRNDQIPYLRYYENGSLTKESNYVSQDRLKEILNI